MTETKNNLLIRDLILEYEKQRNPFRFQIERFCIWPVVRFETFERMKIRKNEYNARVPVVTQGSFAQRLFLFLKEAAKCAHYVLKKKYFDILVVTSTSRLSGKERVSKNNYFDYFSPPLERMLYWYEIDSDSACLRDYSFPYLTSIVASVFGLFFYGRAKRYNQETAKLYDDFLSFLKNEDCSDLMDVSLLKWQRIVSVAVLRNIFFRFLLRKLKPRLVLTECCYGKEGIVAAAKTCGIPVFELQHGIAYDGHMAYTYERKTIEPYRALIPLPDKMLVFGDYFAEDFKKHGFWREEDVLTVGFAKFDKAKESFHYSNKTSHDSLRVLLSSQWILSDYMFDFIQKMMPHLSGQVVLMVKMHPLEPETQAQKYRHLEDRIEVIEKDKNIYDSFNLCHIHGSVFSTTLIESMGLGIPSVVLNLPGAEHIQRAIEGNCVKFAASPELLAKILNRAQKDRGYLNDWHRQTQGQSTYFFKENATKNIKQLINRYVESGKTHE